MFLLTTLLFSIAIGNLIATVHDEIVDPEELKTLELPPPPTPGDSWTDWENWEASPEIKEFFPYYRSGYDEDGRVVYVAHLGKWNHRQLVQMPKEKVEEFWKYYEQYARRLEKDMAMSKGQGTVFIVDWDGFSLAHYASRSALQSALRMFVQIVRINRDMSYGIQINVNYAAETFINMGRPFLGDMFDKFEFYGTRVDKWKVAILRKIPSSQLPPEYGGVEDWKPLPSNSFGNPCSS